MKVGDKFIFNNKITAITNIFWESGGCWIILDNGQQYGDEKDLTRLIELQPQINKIRDELKELSKKDLELIEKYKEYIMEE